MSSQTPIAVYLSSQTPIAAVQPGTLRLAMNHFTYKECIHYYDYGWKKLDNFAPLPQTECKYSMIVADGRLYIVVHERLYRNSGNFYRYDAEQNKWISLEPMSKATNHMVYLNGFIYALHESRDVERYDVSQNRWEKVQQLPLDPQKLCVVAFKGRIFATVLTFYGLYTFCELLLYHPSRNMWQRDVLKEFDGVRKDHYSTKVLFFIHKTQYYKISQQIPKSLWERAPLFTVHVLDVQECNHGEIICTIKDEIKQDPKPDGENTFRIHDEVFVYDDEKGFVYQVGTMKLEPRICNRMKSNVVRFTFDKRKTLYKPNSDSDEEPGLFHP